MLNLDFFSGEVTRSSPVLCHEYCIQDGNLVPRFSLELLTLLLPVFTTHALLPIFPEESWALEGIRTRANSIWKWIRVDVEIFESGKKQLRIQKYPDTCEWTLGWLAFQWAVAKRYSSIWPSSTKSLFVSGTSMQSLQMIRKLKRGQKGWRQLFSETLQRTVFTNNEGILALFHVFYAKTLSPPEPFERMSTLKRTPVSGRNGFNFEESILYAKLTAQATQIISLALF